MHLVQEQPLVVVQLALIVHQTSVEEALVEEEDRPFFTSFLAYGCL